MRLHKFTGPNASSLKYDVLTALSIAGLFGDKTELTSMIRLIALVTARYNWKTDELTVGQRDMARMWNVNERTVKREIKRLVGANILICKRQGVKGRVGAYRLNLTQIYKMTSQNWKAIGPDYENRMSDNQPSDYAKIVHVNFGQNTEGLQPDTTPPPQTWEAVCFLLKSREPSVFTNWFSKLKVVSVDGANICVEAPNKFSAQYIETHLKRPLSEAIIDTFGSLNKLRISYP